MAELGDRVPFLNAGSLAGGWAKSPCEILHKIINKQTGQVRFIRKGFRAACSRGRKQFVKSGDHPDPKRREGMIIL